MYVQCPPRITLFVALSLILSAALGRHDGGRRHRCRGRERGRPPSSDRPGGCAAPPRSLSSEHYHSAAAAIGYAIVDQDDREGTRTHQKRERNRFRHRKTLRSSGKEAELST